MNIKLAKELVIKAGHELVRTGLVARTWGNVSCRINADSFVITPSGREYQTLTLDDIVEVNMEDLSYKGGIVPSSEKGIHRAVYQLRPGINFVIHTHQYNASAISAAGLESFKPLSHYSELRDEVICAKYALPGTKALSKNVTAALKDPTGNAVIMNNHGVLCFGESYEAAFRTAYQLEDASKEFIRGKLGSRYNEIFNSCYPNEPAVSLKESKNIKEVLSSENPCLHEQEALLADCKAAGMQDHIRFISDSEVIHFSKLCLDLKPLVDDFAQIIGTNVKTVDSNVEEISSALEFSSAVFVKDLGALCRGKNERDTEAIGMILRKNCTAYFTASALGHISYIEPTECNMMRKNYLEKYSLMSMENINEKRK